MADTTYENNAMRKLREACAFVANRAEDGMDERRYTDILNLAVEAAYPLLADAEGHAKAIDQILNAAGLRVYLGEVKRNGFSAEKLGITLGHYGKEAEELSIAEELVSQETAR